MNPSIVLAYHGCHKDVGEAILLGRKSHLLPSTKNHEWLGDGIYFWENSYTRAQEWAEKHHGDNAFVLGAIIVPGACLDLTDSRYIDMLSAIEDLFKIDYLALHDREPEPNSEGRHYYDCALINYYRAYHNTYNRETINTVRASFSEGDLLGEGKSAIGTRNHIQWAVITPKQSILGYFRQNMDMLPENISNLM